MNIQESDPEDPYNGLARSPERSPKRSPERSPVFISRKEDYESEAHSPQALGQVYYQEDEHAPLLAQSTTPSALTNVDIQAEEDEKHKKKRWRSIYVMYFTMFLTALTFSIVISSIWPYLLSVDSINATTNFLGWVVASYSFGQLVASPLLGLWADRRPAREPIIVATIINILFNVLYSFCGAFGSGIAGWVMIASRILVGFGAGIGAVCRSYVSEATTTDERIGAMASIGAAQALGFIVGPVLGLAFVPLGSDGWTIPAIRFRLDMYTGPGFLGALLALVNVLLLSLFFRECKLESRKKAKETEEARKKAKELLKKYKAASSVNSPSSSSSLSPPPKQCFDILAASVSIVIFFVILSGFSVFETLLSPLTMDEFAWTRKQAVLYNNLFFAGLSFLTIATLVAVRYITKKVDERVVLMIGMFLLAFAFFILIPMGSDPPQTITMSSLIVADKPNASEVSIISLVSSNETLEAVGCRDPPQDWCSHVPRIHFAQLMVSLLLVTLGYASTSVTIFTIYSRVLGPVRQGVMMGLLTAAGSLARALGPMGLSALYQHYGPYVTFGTVVCILAATILFFLVFSLRLVPYERYIQQKKIFVKLP